MTKKVEMAIGQRIGRLVILKEAGSSGKGKIMWECVCDCGTIKICRGSDLRSGRLLSCGCYMRQRVREANLIDGRRYDVNCSMWYKMIDRCHDPESKAYKNYGARGITVFPPWRTNFVEFVKYISSLPHYREEGRSLDRIDNDKGYYPGNLRWATAKEQSNNMRTNVRIEWNGVTLTAAQWEDQLGYPRRMIGRRIKEGWGVQEALTTPPLTRKEHQ